MSIDVAMPTREEEGQVVDPDEWNERVASCGYVGQASKMAGMTRPRAWSTG